MRQFDIPEAFGHYLNLNWDTLAAFAYQSYQSQGRGVVWVDWINQLLLNQRLSDVGVVYATPTSRISRGLFPEGMSQNLRRLIGKYNPESSIVIYWFDGEVARGRELAMVNAASPKEAYEKMGGRLVEFEVQADVQEN